MDSQKVALVTGASSGIGKAAAKALAQRGFMVYGTSRRANYESVNDGGAGYTMIPLTLEDDQSVADAVKYVAERHGRIDVLINNAGNGIAGAVEDMTIEEAKEQFEVSFFGVLRVIREALPVMRAAGSGTIINIGSLSADFPVPFQGMYSAAKSALFTITLALRMELSPFGVKLCVIEPGNTCTQFKNSRRYAKQTGESVYRRYLERSLCMINSDSFSYSPEACARVALRAIDMKNPPARLSVGPTYKLAYAVSKLASWRMKQSVIRRVYLKKDPPADAEWTFEKQFGRKS